MFDLLPVNDLSETMPVLKFYTPGILRIFLLDKLLPFELVCIRNEFSGNQI